MIKRITKEERDYLRGWVNRLIQERIEFVETCKATGLKVTSFEDALQVLKRSPRKE